MPSASITTSKLALILCLMGCFRATAQENSPYSRYGMGDIYPSQNITNRGMGGMTAAFTDPSGLTVNFMNPASYADFRRVRDANGNLVGGVVLYDLGFSIDSRILRSKSPIRKYSSANFIPSYLTLGVPVAKGLGAVIGVRPLTRINYSIIETTSIPDVDSAQYLFEGNGGLNQAFIGLGKRWNNLSIGFNTGYNFGKRETNTRLNIMNTDTAYQPFYMKSNTSTTTYFGGMFFSAGALWDIRLKSDSVERGKPKEDIWVRLGATATLGKDYNAEQDLLRETFQFDGSGGSVSIDSVYRTTGTPIVVKTPATFNFGMMFHKTLTSDLGTIDTWSFGFEYETSKWTQFRFNGLQDKLNDYWQFRLGGQFIPSTTSSSWLGRSTLRLGFNFGRDYINADNNGLKTFSGSVGLGIPAGVRRDAKVNAALEFGKRGSNVNNITESYFRVSFGLSLSDLWFVKRKYD